MRLITLLFNNNPDVVSILRNISFNILEENHELPLTFKKDAGSLFLSLKFVSESKIKLPPILPLIITLLLKIEIPLTINLSLELGIKLLVTFSYCYC